MTIIFINYVMINIIKTKSGFRIRGYTTILWKSDSLFIHKDNIPFLFSLDKKKKYYLKILMKLFVVFLVMVLVLVLVI